MLSTKVYRQIHSSFDHDKPNSQFNIFGEYNIFQEAKNRFEFEYGILEYISVNNSNNKPNLIDDEVDNCHS